MPPRRDAPSRHATPSARQHAPPLCLPVAGCLFESLLSSYDLRGRARQFIFFVMFMVV
jgi:hypothetical protein